MGATQRDTPISTLAVQIVQAAIRKDVSVSELAKLAQTDPGFAMRLLSVVNSSAYALPNKVNDVPQAASLLGISGLRNLALSLSLSQMVPMGNDGAVLLANSLRRGVAARLVAERLGIKKNIDDYFTAGLFLEAGLLARAGEDLAAAAELARAPASTRTVQERASGQPPHPARGASLAREWSLSDAVAEAIASHHNRKPPKDRLAAVCWLAERLAALFEGGDLTANKRIAEQSAKYLKIDAEALSSIYELLPSQVTDAASGFQRPIGEQPDIDDLLRDANAQLVNLNRNYHLIVRQLETLVTEKDKLNAKLEQMNQRLAHIASTDGLTGLYNYRFFQDSLKRDLHRAARCKSPLSLVLTDVDKFKHFNDNYGHQAGDAVLKAIGKLLMASVRTGDVAARYGGEEFVLILPDTAGEGAIILADRLRQNIAKLRIKLAGEVLQVTSSFGVATASGPCSKLGTQLIESADKAMYAAKEAGRNRVERGDDIG